MHLSDVATILLGLMTISIAFFAYRLSVRANKAQSDSTKTLVDAQAYERAKVLYESAIKTVTDESDRLRTEVSSLHEEVSKLRTEVGRLRAVNTALTREVAELKKAG
jgi:peptidoglycan hydrolase CwlO-like protein